MNRLMDENYISPDQKEAYQKGQDRRLDPLFDYVAQVAVSISDGPPLKDTSGTIAFLYTGERHILVTCRHVREAFEQAVEKYGQAARWLVYGKATPPLDISSYQVLDNGGQSLDVITLDSLVPSEVLNLNKKFWDNWPPERAVEGVMAIAVGYPTQNRFTENDVLRTRRRKMGGPVSSVTDSRLNIVDETLQRVHFRGPGPYTASESLCHGGMSGCAVFLVNDRLQNPRLTGFLYQTTRGANAHILALHADFILADGMIDHTRIAW